MKKGFTLSEVLITLTIIGIISTLVMPVLNTNVNNKHFVSALQATYSQLNDALNEAMATQGITNLMDYDADNPSSSFLNTYMNVASDCGSSYSGCFAKDYTNINGSQISWSDLCDSYVSLKNGASVCMTMYTPTGGNGYIVIDANGAKGPNIAGRDFYILILNHRGNIKNASQYANNAAALSDCKTSTDYSAGCFLYLQNNNWKMDY